MGSLDFVSPHAIMALGMRLKNPAEIFDDIKDLSTATNPQGFASVEQMEMAMRVSFKDDLLSLLGGEITLEIDSVTSTEPVWKAILQVKDSERLQATLDKLLAGMPGGRQQFEEGGITYHTLQILSSRQPMAIGYAFVDGYLVIGSSRATVAESVRLHRNGISLAKTAVPGVTADWALSDVFRFALMKIQWPWRRSACSAYPPRWPRVFHKRLLKVHQW